MMKRLLYLGNKLSGHGFTATNIDTLGPLLETEGYTVRCASSVQNKAFRLADMAWQTFRHGLKSDYVLIDTYSTANFWYAVVVSQICRIIGAKYIPILHGGDLPTRLRSSPRLSRMIFKHAHANVAPSHYLQTQFEKAGFATVHIPNTIEIGKYTFTERNQIGCKLLWVRSFAAIYNPEMALDVFEKMLRANPQAQLCMVGPDKNGYLDKIRTMAQDRKLPVRFTGRLSKEEWTALSAEFDVFINTTHFDNMPVSVIEAMALGLPIVSTNVGGIPFLLEHEKTALLVNDADTQAMADAINRLMVTPELVQRLTRNAAAAAARFDFDHVKHQWAKLLI